MAFLRTLAFARAAVGVLVLSLAALGGATAGNVGPMMIQNYGADLDNPSLFWTNIGGGAAGKLGIGAGLSSSGGNLNVNTGTTGPTIPLNNGGFTQSGTANFTGAFQVGGNAMTFPASPTTLDGLGVAATYTAAHTFTNSDLLLLGSSTGTTTFTSANAGATNYTITIPAASDTLALLNASQTLSNKTLASPTVTGAFTAAGLVTNTDLANPATTVNGQTCTLGSTCTVTAAASSVTSGTTAVGSATAGHLLFVNGTTLGDEAVSSLNFAGSQINSGTVSASYLPTATAAALGVMEVGSGLSVAGGTVSANMLSFNTRTGAVTLSSGDVTSALTYTPLNKGGDSMSGLLGLSYAGSASAAGSTQGTATAITAQTTVVTTVAVGTGVELNPTVGAPQTIYNRGANSMNVYPFSGAAIEANPTNSPVTVPVGGNATFRCISSTECYAGI